MKKNESENSPLFIEEGQVLTDEDLALLEEDRQWLRGVLVNGRYSKDRVLEYIRTIEDRSQLNLSYLDLSNCKISDQDWTDVQCIGFSMRGSKFIECNLTRTNFTCAKLAGVEFIGCVMLRTKLIKAVLWESGYNKISTFRDSILDHVDCEEANLSRIDFRNVPRIHDLHLEGATITGTKFRPLFQWIETLARLNNRDNAFSSWNLYCSITNGTITGDAHRIQSVNFALSPPASFHQNDDSIDNMWFGWTNFENAKFKSWRNPSFLGITFFHCNLKGAFFNNYHSTFDTIRFTQSNIEDLKFRYNGHFKNCVFYDVTANENTQFKGSFSNCNLKCADFTGANFFETEHSKSNFWQTNLSKANFRKAVFRNGCIMDKTLEQTDFRDSEHKETNFDTANLKGAFFNNTDFTKTTFDSADLSGVDFTDCNLDETYYEGAKFDGTILDPPFQWILKCLNEDKEWEYKLFMAAFRRGEFDTNDNLDGRNHPSSRKSP
jgi:uncharacterized protein YjbI with pentapeptide repeats